MGEWNEEFKEGRGNFREGDNNSGPNGGMLKIVCFLLGGRGKRYVRGGGEAVIYLARWNFFNGTRGRSGI